MAFSTLTSLPFTRTPVVNKEEKMVSRAETSPRLAVSRLAPDSDQWWVLAGRVLADLTPQERDIVGERCSISSTGQLTLEEIGQLYGLSRERVRQIVAKVPKRLSDFPVVTKAAAVLAATLGQAASFTQLAAGGFDPADPLVGLLLEVVRVQSNKRFWSVQSFFGVQFLTMDRDFDPTKLPMTAFADADDDGDEVVRDLDGFHRALAARCREIVSESEVDPFMAASFEHCATLHSVNGALVRWEGSYVDKAVRVLRVYGRTTPAATLDQIVAPGKYRPVTARIQSRESAGRIIRAADGNYGLPDWDWLKPYVELGPAMQQAIVNSGGRISLRRLRRIVGAAGFSQNSVSIYAQMHPVFVFEDDVVRLRDESEPASTKPIESSPRCYRVLSGRAARQWSFVTAISYGDLRAGSLTIPGAFGALLGLRPGKTEVTLHAEETQLKASWVLAPYIWSSQLKQLLKGRGAIDGQILRIIDTGSGSVALQVDDPVPVDGSPVAKIATVIGLDGYTDIEEVVQGLAKAIGLNGSPSGVDILRRLQDRGETSMRDLLLEIVPELMEAER